MGQLLKLLFALGLSGSVASAAAGSWNGVSFTAWNAIAITSWNGTAIATTTPTTLNVSLVSYWKLDEASGTRADSEPTGTPQDLTDNNTVTSNTGKLSSSGQFTAANSEYLSRADSTDLSTGNIDFTVAAWVYMDTKPSSANFVTKWTSGVNTEWYLNYTAAVDRFRFATYAANVDADNFGSPSTATWYLIIAWHDSVNDLMGISVNDGTANTFSNSDGTQDGNAAFNIGRLANGFGYNDGRIDEVGFWKKVLTSGERTELYNAGTGKTCCPF